MSARMCCGDVNSPEIFPISGKELDNTKSCRHCGRRAFRCCQPDFYGWESVFKHLKVSDLNCQAASLNWPKPDCTMKIGRAWRPKRGRTWWHQWSGFGIRVLIGRGFVRRMPNPKLHWNRYLLVIL